MAERSFNKKIKANRQRERGTGESSMVNMSFYQYSPMEPEVEEPAFLADFSETDRQKIYSIGDVQNFSAGDIVVTEWANDSAFFIILEGNAVVLLPKWKGGWHTLASLGTGEVFGELSFFDRRRRSARVAVLTDSQLLRIDEDAFHHLQVLDTKLALRLVQDLGKILSHRLRHMNDLVRTLVN